MFPVSDKSAEPPGVSGIKIIQDSCTGLYNLECCLSPGYFQLINNTIFDEMMRLNRIHSSTCSAATFTPGNLCAAMDPDTHFIHCECELDLHYLRLVIDALENTCNVDDNSEFDVFISYAHADEDYVQQLVECLHSLGIRVWFDKNQIRWGDEHRAKMDYGIRHSRYSIVVCSANYFSEYRYWTKTELNAAYQAESIHEHQILPLWHHITPDQLYNYSSMLASRDHLDTSMHSPLEIAVEMLSLLNPVNLNVA